MKKVIIFRCNSLCPWRLLLSPDLRAAENAFSKINRNFYGLWLVEILRQAQYTKHYLLLLGLHAVVGKLAKAEQLPGRRLRKLFHFFVNEYLYPNYANTFKKKECVIALLQEFPSFIKIISKK